MSKAAKKNPDGTESAGRADEGSAAPGNVAPSAAEPGFPAPEAGQAGAPGAADESALEAQPSVQELERQLEEAKATADAHWETVLRTRADLENLRKRSERDLENAHKYGVDRFVSEMLPVKDSLELGMAAASDDEVDVQKVREGMELTLKMFASALDKLGVSEIDPKGQRFDPEFHQAMTMQEADGQEPGSVISVIQKGYLLNERLIRPALVVVAK
ncbi:MAG: nucleotide exchange factor GrpE [Gammaproteobacteria bacterium]|nr:nucleotide exchange factor GrpE [Gammaproteobacteria bacterium]